MNWVFKKRCANGQDSSVIDIKWHQNSFCHQKCCFFLHFLCPKQRFLPFIEDTARGSAVYTRISTICTISQNKGLSIIYFSG